MTVFVTGGAGYIGSVTVEKLVESGFEVVVLDNLEKGHKSAIHPKVKFIHGDLCDLNMIKKVLKKNHVDSVIHFAAYSLVGESVAYPDKYFKNNVENGINLLEAMVELNIKKIIFSSSAATYGEPMDMPITEDTPTLPTNPYGKTKLIFEKKLIEYDEKYGIKFISLRYFNAAGASARYGEDHKPETHIIPLILKVVMGQTGFFEIYGKDYKTDDGTCIRDYIHVEDLATAHILALENLESQSNFYNLGNGEGYSVKEVVETARKVTGHEIPVIFKERRAGDPPVLIASSKKIRDELGWQPMLPDLAEMVRSALIFHKKYPYGYED